MNKLSGICVCFLIVIIFSLRLQAGDSFTTPYRSVENSHYWKNHPPTRDYWQQDIHYQIKATIDDKTDIADADYKLTYWNNSPDTLSELFFHLNENAFQPGSYYADLWKNNKLVPKYGKYEAKGLGTTFENFRINGENVYMELDNTILRVKLSKALLPGQSLEVTCQFKTYFDMGSMRRRNKILSTMGTKQYDGVHWYPIICVYDAKFGWHTDQHLDKEFYADFGSFDVELTFPQEYIVEATGVLMNKDEVMPDTLRQKLDLKNFKDKPYNSAPSIIVPKQEGKTKTWKYYAVNVHNFAFTADPLYRIEELDYQGIKVIALVQEPHASRWVPSAAFTARVMDIYCKDFGAYIWPKIIVADAQDGMEYPMLTLDGGTYPAHQGLLAHEVGHMWFYGMVASNETYRASLDEGFTQFLTVWAMDKITGIKRPRPVPGGKYITRHTDSIYTRMESLYQPYLTDVNSGYDEPLNTHSSGFNGAIRHGGSYRLVYYKTGVMLYNLRYVLGDSVFLGAMQYYFNKWKMAHPYPEDFRDAITAYTKTDLTWFFDQWMETTKYIDYKIEKISRRSKLDAEKDNVYEITLRRIGRMQMSIDFTVTTTKGKFNYYIPNTWYRKATDATVLSKWYGWDLIQPTYTTSLTVPGIIKNVEIDPTHTLADADLTNNALKGNSTLEFDHRVFNTPNWLVQKNYWRPDLWWNRYDGVQAGINIYGDYFGQNFTYDYSAWWNTRLGQYNIPQEAKNKNQEVAFSAAHKYNLSRYWRQLFVADEFHYNAGLLKYMIGFEKIFRQQDLKNPRYTRIYINHQWMYRKGLADTLYLLYPPYWSRNEMNSCVNVGIQKVYPTGAEQSEWNLEMRVPGLANDFNYSYIQFTTINKFSWKKWELRTRIFGRIGWGNTPLESALYLAGASPEQLYNNKLTRAAGFVPDSWTGYGTGINHFHMGGGLNVRGYAGYLAPVVANSALVYNHVGLSGASISLELDFDKWIPIPTMRYTKNLHFDTYLFHDMGILTYQSGGESKQHWGDLRASSGVGTALTIKFGSLMIKPLIVRFDMPLLLNAAPATESNAQMRYVIGIQRSF